MKKKNALLYGLFGLLAIVWLFNLINTPPALSGVRRAPSSALIPEYTAASLADETRRIVSAHYPGSSSVTLNEADGAIAVEIWLDAFNTDALNHALLEIKYLDKWHELTDSLCELSATMQDQYAAHDHPELRSVVRLLDPDDRSRCFALAAEGVLIYDILDDVPPGEAIPGSSFDGVDTGLRDYVINTASGRFHLPGCRAAGAIGSDNREEYTGTRGALMDRGLVPCEVCCP